MATVCSVEAASEVYPNPPLALVAAEARFPPVSDQALSMRTHREIRDFIGPGWVITNDPVTLGFHIGIGAPSIPPPIPTVARITSRQKTKIVTVQPDMFTVEVSDYDGFDDFRSLLTTVAQGIENIIQPDGISRLGLRYINEITVPESPPVWSQWLNPSIVQPTFGTMVTSAWTGKVLYEIESDQKLALSYGTSDGPLVSPAGPLKRSDPAAGPVFLIDFDSFWEPSEIPELNTKNIIDAADRLHAPLRGMFDHLVLPDLIDHFREKA